MAQLKNMTAEGVLPVASPPATVRSYDILTYSEGKVAPSVFLSCREQTLTVHVNGVPFVRVACSGQHLRYLVPGFLYSCGLINSLHDLAGMDITPMAANTADQAQAQTQVQTQDRSAPRCLRTLPGADHGLQSAQADGVQQVWAALEQWARAPQAGACSALHGG